MNKENTLDFDLLCFGKLKESIDCNTFGISESICDWAIYGLDFLMDDIESWKYEYENEDEETHTYFMERQKNIESCWDYLNSLSFSPSNKVIKSKNKN